ncbi:acyl-CoA synthetase family protein [Pseudoxanthomonas sangjuensis]|uniref:ApeI family dehydratase n=1 Tax=Pseudoxanthomonas sangjuensis TaxID=1503750 RepID=UPI001390F7EC|nr:AMP-binding protein [Pseudoxanthomonas sangjuensis]KAF1714068.1 AMP-binding protein [Pseudoxanthomonas sangjuensis]
MAEWIGLERIALAPHRERAGHARFVQRARDWHAAFAARAESDWALFFEDAGEFAAALFGAWHAGKRVFLPGDALPATLESIATQAQGFAGDIPAAHAPLAAPGSSGDGRGMQALDSRATRLVVFTSGSTGTPAALEKQLCQLEREVEALQSAFGDGLDGAVVHGTVSHQHIYGLLFRVLWPLAAGREVAPRSFFHEELLAIPGDGPLLLVSSPAHLKRLPERFDATPLHGRLRAVFSSGGALPAQAAIEARRVFGVAPTEIFGSSETGGIAWRRWDDDVPAWRALPGVQWRLAGDALEVDSPYLPPATGWWRTTDRAESDGHGGFRLLGRADRIAKIEERRVSLDALERALATHPFVREARVVVLEGARSVLAAAVATSDEGKAQLQALGRRGFAKQLDAHLSDSQDAVTRPRRWRFVDGLPVDAQGKTTQAALLALFRPAQPQPRWLQRDARSAELALELDPRLLAFDGHFPQAPILPGVVQTDWAIRFGREAFALPPRFLRLEALKFQQVARPGQVLRLRLDWNPEGGVLSFRYDSEAGAHAGGRAVFGDG